MLVIILVFGMIATMYSAALHKRTWREKNKERKHGGGGKEGNRAVLSPFQRSVLEFNTFSLSSLSSFLPSCHLRHTHKDSHSVLLHPAKQKNKNKTRNKSRNKIKDKREAKNLRLGDKLGPRLIRDNVTEGRDLALELARLVGPLEDRRLVLGSGRHVVSLLVLREAVVVVAGDSEA